jgi:hypothetical protein
MAQIDVIRPVSTLKTGAGAVVPSGTMNSVTSDDSDATYIDFNVGDSGNWSLRLASHTPPAGFGRHRLRGRIRVRTDAGFVDEDIDVGRGTVDFISYQTFQVSSAFTEKFTAWFQNPDFGLAEAGALDDLNIGGGWPANVSGAAEIRTAECYIDIDCREQPTYSAEVRDAAGVNQAGGTVTDTTTPTLFFGEVAYDGLVPLDWQVEVNGILVDSGVGTPPTSVPITSGLADGSYSAVFEVRSTIRASDTITGQTTLNFDVENTVPPPSPPVLSVSEEAGGYRVDWSDPGGQTWDNGYVVAEVYRDDCNGSQRIATVPDGLNGTYLDLAIPQLDNDPCGSAETCDITYRVRYWGYVSTTVELPDSIPEDLILGWPSTAGSIPGGWTRVTALDGRYPRGATSLAAPSATGGSASHSHTTSGHLHAIGSHNHALGGNTGTSNTNTTTARFNGASHTVANQPHSHARPATTGTRAGQNSGTTAPATDAIGNTPPTRTVIWIQSDGTQASYPIGVVGWATENVSGWGNDAASFGRFLRGAAAAGNGGASSGASTHTHEVDAHDHVGFAHDHSIGSTGLSNPLAATEAAHGSTSPRWLPRHTHPMELAGNGTGNIGLAGGGPTNSINIEPPNRRLRVLQNTGGGIQTRIIGLYMGSVASLDPLLTLCDGANGTPDMRGYFVRDVGSDSVNSTGGSLTHSHTVPSHTHLAPGHVHTTDVLASNTTSYERATSGDLGNVPTTSHDHSSADTAPASPSVSSSGSGVTNVGDHMPLFVDAHFVRLDGIVAGGSLPVPELKVSDFSSATVPSFVYDDGLDRLASMDTKISVVTDRNHDYPRLVTDSTPLDGGLHSVSTTLAGEDVTLTIGVQGKPAIDQLEQVLGADRVYYSPVGGTPGWYAPAGWRVTAPAPDVKVLQVVMVRQDWPTTPEPSEFL